MELFIFILIFAVGIAVGAFIASKVASYRASRMLHKRGEALRKIKNYKWDTGEHNDAVVICRIAMDGLKYE